MKKLIEFKLWAGNFPYFVDTVIGGVEINGKRYGVSKDCTVSYLPDTVKELTAEEFVNYVKQADVYTQSEEDPLKVRLMTDDEKEKFAREWLVDTLADL